MSWIDRLTTLFSSASEIRTGVGELTSAATPSSRAGQQQRCGACRELGHKAPTCTNNPVSKLEKRVKELELGLLAERDRAERHKELRDMAEDQLRIYAQRVDELDQEVAGLKQMLAAIDSTRGVDVYGRPTR